MSGRGRKAASRLLLVLFGTAAALLVLEALLQLGALVTRMTGRELPVAGTMAGRRVLCLGDSNTYGFYLERSEAYPNVLAALAAADGRPLEVLNLGQPGINSSRLRSELPRMLATFRPAVVTIMVGVNDFWTVPVAVGDHAGAVPSWPDRLWKWSRVFRMLYMLRRSLERADVAVEVTPRSETDRSSGRGRVAYGGQVFTWEWRPQEGGVPDFAPALVANLEAMTAEVRESGAEPILLTYPSEASVYAVTNRVLRQAAARTGTPLVDLGAELRPLCPTPECPDLFFPDQHPRAPTHRRVAELLLARLDGQTTAGGR
jgi:hypothetical protein